jgi:hypothetical protein
MNKSDLSKFKDQLNNLINHICKINKNDKDFEKIRIKLSFGLDANPRAVAERFVQEIIPHAKQILESDDTYFMSLNYNEMYDLKNEENYLLQIENKLKSLWSNINDNEREEISKYIKILLCLGCLATRNEELRKIINEYRENPLVFKD